MSYLRLRTLPGNFAEGALKEERSDSEGKPGLRAKRSELEVPTLNLSCEAASNQRLIETVRLRAGGFGLDDGDLIEIRRDFLSFANGTSLSLSLLLSPPLTLIRILGLVLRLPSRIVRLLFLMVTEPH